MVEIIQSFKRYTTIKYIKMVKQKYYNHLKNEFGNVIIGNI